MENNSIEKVKILENARILLEKDGLKGLTVHNIIEKCEVSKTTFYKHFPTKKDLLLQLKYLINNNSHLTYIKDQIAAVAKDCFVKYGIGSVDMEMISRTANLNRMTLFRYFSSKNELIDYCLKKEINMFEKFQNELQKILEEPENALVHLLFEFKKIAVANPFIFEALNHIPRLPGLRAHTSGIHDSITGMYLQILETGKKKGIYKKDFNPSIFINMIMIIQNGMLVKLAVDKPDDTMDKTMEIIADMVSNYLSVT